MSVNGTFLDQEEEPIAAPHRLRPDDKFSVGPFEIQARLTGEALAHHQETVSVQAAAAAQENWNSWDDTPASAQNSAPNSPTQDNETWGVETIATEDVSHWSDKSEPEPLGPTSDEIFNTLSNNHEVDWDSTAWDVEEDFDPFAVQDLTSPAEKKDPFGSLGPTGSDSLSNINADFDTSSNTPTPQTPPNTETDSPEFWDKWQAGENPTRLGTSATAPNRVAPAQAIPPVNPAPSVQTTPPISAQPQSQEVYKKLISGIGIPSANLTENPEDTAARSGRMLRRLLAGLVTLLEARARAKDAMGASSTQLRLDGNNPLKFARDIDQALQMVMNPARPGYMEIDIAIEDSYRDLQAHQIATIKAMQGALKSTIERFSPDTIKKEAEENGFLKKILPGQREAALWKAYEKQFNGSVQGSAEAFFDTFSVEFRKAYEDATRKS